jgi:hypothetical protein
VITSTVPKGTLGSVASLLTGSLFQGNPDRNHKLWNIGSTERYILHIEKQLKCGTFTFGKFVIISFVVKFRS